MTPNRVGLSVGAAFGLIYVLVNARALSPPLEPALQVLGSAAFVGVLVQLRPAGTTPAATDATRPGFGRGYWIVVVAEVAAFAIGNAVLTGPLDLPQGVLPWVSFVVGVHFLALAKVWGEASLGWLGAGIAVLGALGLVLAGAGASEATIASVAGVGPGALLLGGSLWSATRERRRALRHGSRATAVPGR